jgi:putative transport protein
VLGGLLAVVMSPLITRPAAAGLYCGAFTTTPGLAAAQETLRAAPASSGGQSLAAPAALAYSITYPFGIVGPMLVVLALKKIFRVNIDDERVALAKMEERNRSPLEVVDMEVTLQTCGGKRLQDFEHARHYNITFTRLLRDGVVTVPTADTVMKLGDRFRTVGPREQLSELISQLGRRIEADWNAAPGDVHRKEFVVTHRQVLRRSLRELNLRQRTGVVIGIVHRSGVDLPVTGSLRLAFGDRVSAVGPEAGLKQVEAELGNSVAALDHTQLGPIFLGIFAAVVLGSIPIALPKVGISIRMGLAAGALVAAIMLSRIRSFGPVVWYMPAAANQLFRDFGLAIFLACVGFQAGDHFIQRAANSSGLSLLLLGAAVTVVPVFFIACYARVVMKMNFIALSGWVAGAMSSTTTLDFATDITSSNAPSVVFAAVVPIAELLPIICAQLLAIIALHQ